MYTEIHNNHIEDIHINLCNGSQCIDKNKLFDLIDKLKNNYYYVIEYGSLQHPDIIDILNKFNSLGNLYTIKINSYKDISILKRVDLYNVEIICKIDCNLCYEIQKSDLNNNYLLFKELLHIKKECFSVLVEVYVDSYNIKILKETLKCISKESISSKICFYGYAKNGKYSNLHTSDNCCKNDYENELIIDNIIKDDTLLIKNKSSVLDILNGIMNFVCDIDIKCTKLFLDANFKFKLCNKINTEVSLDVFDCFEENGSVKQELIDELCNQYKKYCFGCSCEEYF